MQKWETGDSTLRVFPSLEMRVAKFRIKTKSGNSSASNDMASKFAFYHAFHRRSNKRETDDLIGKKIHCLTFSITNKLLLQYFNNYMLLTI